MIRGIGKQQSHTVTTAWPGEFERDPSRRQEFLAAVRRGTVARFPSRRRA